jgi:heat shock protein HslJ
MKTILFFCLVLLLMIAGCAPQPTVGGFSASLNGDWKSTISNATVRFDEGKVSGSDGCNRFGSTYTIQNNTLQISNKMMSTMMACPSPVMEQSTAFKNVLLGAKSYTNDGKTLVLLGAKGEILGELSSLSSTQKP